MTSSTDPDGVSQSGSPGSSGDPSTDTGAIDKSTILKKEEAVDVVDAEKRLKESKDPSRPRRKKARRACHACQRAHLTCGDERPCGRCLKRGLGDQCCDGVRKKAKYLHDTPNEAFLPGGMSHYNYMSSMRQPSRSSQDVPFNLASPTGDVYGPLPAPAAGYNVFRPNTSPAQVTEGVAIGSQQYIPPTPTGPASYASPQGQQGMQTLLDAAQHTMTADQASQPVQDGYGNHFFDANDISKFNFDPSTFNFGNHYGALEFGMLGHMATGAAETPPSDSGTQYNQSFASPVGISGFAESPMRARSFSMGQQDQAISDWQPHQTAEMAGAVHINPTADTRAHVGRGRRLPAAIAINVSHTRDGLGRLTGTITPPATDLPPAQLLAGRETPNGSSRDSQNTRSLQSSPQMTRAGMATNGRAHAPNAAQRSPVDVYNSVEGPYNYVRSWHHIRNILAKRFEEADYLRAAKAMASIRPSFIAASQHLVHEDLIIQEKCFQRALLMHESFFSSTCTPTIICRRTGIIAAVNDEFCMVTGWSRAVLLGSEPNLNENMGYKRASGDNATDTSSSTLPGTGASSHGGTNTPRTTDAFFDPSEPRALFLAELINDEALLAFYNDYSRMAFGEPRGAVETRMLLRKYRTKADMANSISKMKNDEQGDFNGKIYGGSEDEDFVDCRCVWTIKRDLFDTPMAIILNFLPILN